MCLRGDTDFSLTAHLDRWSEDADFVFGMDNNATLRGHAEALDPSAWTRLVRPPKYVTTTGTARARRDNVKKQIVVANEYVNLRLNHEDVAEFDYRPNKCRTTYRVVVLRKNISRSKDEQALIDEIRYFFYITTYTAATHTPAQIVELANDRCDQENIWGQLKSGLDALHAPVGDLNSNWAYMLIAALAWNIKSWHAMTMHRIADRRTHIRIRIRIEFKRFLDTIIEIPAMVLTRARGIVIRLVAYTTGLAGPPLQRLDHHRAPAIRLRRQPPATADNPRPRHPSHRRAPATAMPPARQRQQPPTTTSKQTLPGPGRLDPTARPNPVSPEYR